MVVEYYMVLWTDKSNVEIKKMGNEQRTDPNEISYFTWLFSCLIGELGLECRQYSPKYEYKEDHVGQP